MIIKSIPRKKPSFKKLVEYIRKEDDATMIFHNMYISDYTNNDYIIQAFDDNSQLLPQWKNWNYLYHEVISFENSGILKTKTKRKEIDNILHDVASLYLYKRASNNLACCTIHRDTNNIHLHFCISANELWSSKRLRLSKAQFATVQRDLEKYVLEQYPELKQSKVYDKPKNKEILKTTRTEQEYKRKTKKASYKEEVKTKLHGIFEQAQDYEQFTQLLEQAGFELYPKNRKKYVGVINTHKNNRKHRFKTLGLLPHYEATLQRLTQESSTLDPKRAELDKISKQHARQKTFTPKSQTMNAKQAKQIPLEQILAKLWYSPRSTKGSDLWYYSPFRDEKTASFKVNTKLNTWYDFGLGAGGTVIDFFIERYQDKNISHILQKIANMDTSVSKVATFSNYPRPRQETHTPIIHAVKEIRSPSLVAYVEHKRWISVQLARQYMSEVHYQVKDKNYFAVGLANETWGFDLRNQYFKGNIWGKAITCLKGEKPSNRVAVFEWVLDFLSLLSLHQKEKPPHDVIILNSVALLPQAVEKIAWHQYKEIHCYLDNDTAGEKARHDLYEKFKDLQIIDHSGSYQHYKDINDYFLAHTQKQRSLDVSGGTLQLGQERERKKELEY